MKNNAYEGIDCNSWSSVDFDASSGFVVSWEARSANWFVSNENYWRREQMTVDLPSPRTSRIASSTSSKKLCTRHKVFENPKSDYSIREYVDDSICKCGRYFSPPSNLHFSGSCHTINIDIRHQLSCLSRQKPLDGLHYNGTLCNRCVSNHDCAGNMSPIATIVSSSSSSLTQRRSGCERYKHDIMPPEDTDDQRSCRPVASSSNYKIACHVVNSGANREGTRQLPAIFAGDQDLLTSSNLISSGHYEETLCWDEIYQPRPFTSAAGGPVVNSEKFQEDVKGNNLGTSGRELHRWKPNSIWKSSVPRFARRNKCSDARDSLASDGHVDTPSPPNRTAPTQPVQSIWISDACENNSSPEECESNLMASVTHLNSVVIAMPIGESSNSCADVGSSLEHITGRKRLSFDDLNYKYACDNINARTSFMRNSTCGESGRKSSYRNGIKSEQMMLDTSPTSVYRPLPDQSAFDRFALGNLNGASNDCGRVFHLHQGSWLTSPIQSLAACPATPLRTPTWILTSTAIYNTANEGSAGVEVPVRLHTMRPSSLIATKVLFSQCGTPEKSDVSFYRDFEQEDFLGSGVSADVFKAKEKGGKKFYAVKKIKQRFRSKKDRYSMMGEVTIMKKLGFEPCKHIVQLVKAWQEDAHFYVQLDFAELGTLSDLLRNVALKMGRFTDRAVWCIVNNVSAGLCHIHKHGIVHLDIKPANLLISIEGVIKICDFGSAVEEGNHEDSHEGDTRYMAPELLASSDRYPPADVFSLGLSIYEVCVLSPLPSEGPGWRALRDGRSHLTGRGAALCAFYSSALNIAPSNRPTAQSIGTLPDVINATSDVEALLSLATLYTPAIPPSSPPHFKPTVDVYDNTTDDRLFPSCELEVVGGGGMIPSSLGAKSREMSPNRRTQVSIGGADHLRCLDSGGSCFRETRQSCVDGADNSTLKFLSSYNDPCSSRNKRAFTPPMSSFPPAHEDTKHSVGPCAITLVKHPPFQL